MSDPNSSARWRAARFGSALGSLLLLLSCGPSALELPQHRPARELTTPRPRLLTQVKPSRLIPLLDASSGDVVGADEGRQRLLVGGLRIIVHDGGRVERGDERFAGGAVHSLALPPRLGGGFLFYQADRNGTRLWTAADWVAPLAPVAKLAATADEVIIGFDRLYVRVEGSNQLLAVDVDSKRIAPLGRLPAAGAFGAMSFADGWRAVVETDLRGPLATFDGGATWNALAIAEPIEGAGVEQGDPVLYVGAGSYRVDAWGRVQFVARSTEEGTADGGEGAPSAANDQPKREPKPFGDSPLRTAILAGWPDSSSTVIVARHGAVGRVSLPDGEVKTMVRGAFPERDAECHGAPVGRGFGFVCGEPGGATAIYAYEPPLQLRGVARFASPRFVSAAGNGALAVRGGCGAQRGPPAEIRTYCIVGVDGSRHEVGVRGDLGAERVVPLRDGRVVVLVPPRMGAPGRLTTIAGDALRTVELALPKEPPRAARLAKTGLWLEGFQQRGADSIGGWIEAGGPVLGVSVTLAGKVSLGKVVDRGGEVLLAGPFALVAAETEGGLESTDGGKTWLEFELPRLPSDATPDRTRGCSPVGCVLPDWLRVGWGKPAEKRDLQLAPTPDDAFVQSAASRSVSARCKLGSQAARDRAGGGEGRSRGAATFGDWRNFGGLPAPELRKDDVGVAKGTSEHDSVPAHVFVWGPKGADWSRAGHWIARFQDRFAARGPGHSSAPTRPAWTDRVTAGEAIGAQSRGGYWRWAARLDPSGRSALLAACRRSDCRLYTVTAGRPISTLRDPTGGTAGFLPPVAHGVVRVGETWYFLTDPGKDSLSLWRAELGVAVRLHSYRRLRRGRYGVASAPRLVRRAVGREVGLLVTVPADPSLGGRAGRWVVLPVEPDSGALGEPIDLGPTDLAGELPPLCSRHDDGWLVDGPLDNSVALRLSGVRAHLDSIELRLRLEPGAACVVAMAARAGRPLSPVESSGGRDRSSRREPVSRGTAIPLAVRAQSSAARWQLWCDAARPPEASVLDRLLGQATPSTRR